MPDRSNSVMREQFKKLSLVLETAGAIAVGFFAQDRMDQINSLHIEMSRLWYLGAFFVPFLLHIAANNYIKFAFRTPSEEKKDKEKFIDKEYLMQMIVEPFTKPFG